LKQFDARTTAASFGRDDPDDAASMMFIQVSESKEVKNRVHLVLHADDRAAEVERLVSLGATIVHDKDEWNVRWTTLTDPQGNEFCVATH
jgi:predicted enzyme related to lactoylglutathione lyase